MRWHFGVFDRVVPPVATTLVRLARMFLSTPQDHTSKCLSTSKLLLQLSEGFWPWKRLQKCSEIQETGVIKQCTCLHKYSTDAKDSSEMHKEQSNNVIHRSNIRSIRKGHKFRVKGNITIKPCGDHCTCSRQPNPCDCNYVEHLDVREDHMLLGGPESRMC